MEREKEGKKNWWRSNCWEKVSNRGCMEKKEW